MCVLPPNVDSLVVHVTASVDVRSSPVLPAATHRLLPKATENIAMVPKFEVRVVHVVPSVEVLI